MADYTVSGNQGSVLLGSSDLCVLSKWDLTIDQAINSTVVHCTAPWHTTSRGNKKVSGTISAKWHSGSRLESLAFVDTIVALELHMTSAAYWSGNARLGAITHDVNIETGENEGVTVAFEGDGTWTKT